jgi:hypothetical protein
MTSTLMRNSQQAAWSIGVSSESALRVPAADHARWLTVTDGRLWLTADGEPCRPSDDVWLDAGQGVVLPAGADAVLEGAPRARFQLVEAVVSRRQRGVFVRRWLRGARRAWLTAPAAPCAA